MESKDVDAKGKKKDMSVMPSHPCVHSWTLIWFESNKKKAGRDPLPCLCIYFSFYRSLALSAFRVLFQRKLAEVPLNPKRPLPKPPPQPWPQDSKSPRYKTRAQYSGVMPSCFPRPWPESHNQFLLDQNLAATAPAAMIAICAKKDIQVILPIFSTPKLDECNPFFTKCSINDTQAILAIP